MFADSHFLDYPMFILLVLNLISGRKCVICISRHNNSENVSNKINNSLCVTDQQLRLRADGGRL